MMSKGSNRNSTGHSSLAIYLFSSSMIRNLISFTYEQILLQQLEEPSTVQVPTLMVATAAAKSATGNTAPHLL